jgi:serine/threonine-protein kinase
MRFQVGQKVGDYEFLAVVEATQTGVTYRVQNLLADRQELLKVLPPDLQDDQERVERFLREAKIHARLRHPNIAAFYTATRVDGRLAMTSELVEGGSLEQRISSGSLSIDQTAKYFEQALSALSYAHGEGVVHRDIKPGHLIITRDDNVKIIGFGLAKKSTDAQLTQPGIVMGSVHYMSPEQVKGSAELDRRSDIYSLGVVLYEAVTGKKPFDSKSQFEVFLAHVNQEPAVPSSVRAGIPAALDQIILTAMAKQPASRFQTAEEFRDSLSKLQGVVSSPDGGRAVTPQPESLAPEAEQQTGAKRQGLESSWRARQPEPVEGSASANPTQRYRPEASSPLGAPVAPAANSHSEPRDPLVRQEPRQGADPASSGGVETGAPPAGAERSRPAAAFSRLSEIGRGEAPASAATSPAAGTGRRQTPRESRSVFAEHDDAWSEHEGSEQVKDIPLLLRPTGAGAHGYSPGAKSPSHEPEASAGSWFGEHAFAGWTSKDILAVGALTFVIVAAVFFVLLTFLNR